jgi:hypothetical protein
MGKSGERVEACSSIWGEVPSDLLMSLAHAITGGAVPRCKNHESSVHTISILNAAGIRAERSS